MRLHQIQHVQMFLLMDCQTGEWESCWLGLDIEKGMAFMWWCRFKDNVVKKCAEFFCPMGWFWFESWIVPRIMQRCNFSNSLLSNVILLLGRKKKKKNKNLCECFFDVYKAHLLICCTSTSIYAKQYSYIGGLFEWLVGFKEAHLITSFWGQI